MKFIIITDIHFGLSDEEIAFLEQTRPDAYLFLGDIFPEIKKYIHLLKDVPKFGVQGNHDCLPGFADVYKKYGIHLLDENPVCISNAETEIYLVGLSETKNRYHGMAQISEQEIENNAVNKLKHMPAVADLPKGTIRMLLSHDSGLGDIENGAGFVALSDCRREVQPNLHLFGHYHCYHCFYDLHTDCICTYRISELVFIGQEHGFSQISKALDKPVSNTDQIHTTKATSIGSGFINSLKKLGRRSSGEN